MFRRALATDNFADWRNQARDLLRHQIPPDQIDWIGSQNTQQPLFSSQSLMTDTAEPAVVLPAAFVSLAELVARHSDPGRWAVLYRVAWRILHGERHLLHLEIDDDVAILNVMRRAVERDAYKMRAFIRFRKVNSECGEQFVAWYRPEHQTLASNAKFFVDRFGSMRWAILTPELSLFWDLKQLQTGPGVPRSQAPPEDELEDLWRTYYSTIYDPARLNLTAMRAQLPVRRWVDLPEARIIPELVRLSAGRVQQMADNQPRSASEFIPQTRSLTALQNALRKCSACGLCRRATQPVWGEGNPNAHIMLVGEQPGDEEDLAGRPFVGPAGQILDQALHAAGLPRSELYVTNAVKAFRFEQRGKRRLHQTPRNSDIEVCRPWLLAELDAVQPQRIVCLGATAAQSVLGRKVQIKAERGRLFPHAGAQAAVTYHPSAVLRNPDMAAQERLLADLISDLTLAKSELP
jgi:DNA polymerase